MKRGLAVSVAGVAVLVAGLTGCSKDETTTSRTPAPTSTSAPVPDASDSSAASGTTKVSIDGQAWDIPGEVDCSGTREEGTAMAIEVGNRGPRSLGLIVTKTDPPAIRSISIGVAPTAVSYPDAFGLPGTEATVTKNGNTYNVSGIGSGFKYNASADEAPVTMSFDAVVTCP